MNLSKNSDGLGHHMTVWRDEESYGYISFFIYFMRTYSSFKLMTWNLNPNDYVCA